jgi:hypothetical protein
MGLSVKDLEEKLAFLKGIIFDTGIEEWELNFEDDEGDDEGDDYENGEYYNATLLGSGALTLHRHDSGWSCFFRFFGKESWEGEGKSPAEAFGDLHHKLPKPWQAWIDAQRKIIKL